MKKRKMKGMLVRRAFCHVMALAMVFSSLTVPQGAITVHAEEPLITAVEDTTSPYKRTQIVNGDFEQTPWQDFVLPNGDTYTAVDSSVSSKIARSIPNGVGEGWNTTEIQPYKGNLFEVWPSNSPLDPNEATSRFTGNGIQFIEMNTTNPACLYQDLPTQSGDVIKWTLQHAARNNLGFATQRMYVTIGKPEIDGDGKIVVATGVGIEIDTKIQADGKAEYRYYDGAFVASGSAARANPGDLDGLSVSRSAIEWQNASGIYIVPEGQDVTRFAFCADAKSKLDSENSSDLSGGNFLDNITFSTLVGNLKATKIPAASEDPSGTIKVTGFWGDEDASNHLFIKAGDTVNKIDMSSVTNQNFVITVPDTTTSESASVEIYHEDYQSAVKTVPVSHEHAWTYEVPSEAEVNQISISAQCTNTTDAGSCSAQEAKTLTLQAPDAEYTGKPYNGAAFDTAEKNAWLNAELDLPQIWYEGVGDTIYESSPIAPTNAGTYQATMTVGVDQKAKATFTISPKSITGAGMSVTITPNSYEYTGNTLRPNVVVKDGSKVLSDGSDYVLSDETTGSAVKANYSVTITGQGNYTGSTSKNWNITNAKITDITKQEFSGTYDGEPHSATVSVNAPSGATVTYSETAGGSYDATAPEYTEAGIHTIYYKIEKENYVTTTGGLTVNILPKSLTASGITVEIDHDSYVYNGAEKAPVITVKDGVKTLTLGTDYTLSGNTTGSAISGDVDYKITVQGTGNYTDTVEQTWKIVASGNSGGGTGGSGDSGSGTGGSGGTGSGTGGSGGSGSGTGGSGGSGSDNGGSGGTGSGSGTSTGPVENFNIPVKNENTVKVGAEIQNGTANVSEITNNTVDKIVNNKNVESKVDTITIDLSGAKQEVTGVTLSKESVKTLAETTARNDNGIDTATIELSKATVVLDNQTLQTLVEQAKGTQIELVVADTEQNNLKAAQKTALSQCQVATTFEAYFTSDGQRIHDFKGGKAIVSIDFTPEAGKDTSYYHLVYVADNGQLTRYKTKYQDGKLMFTTTHFSDYAVIYDTGEKNETEKKEEKDDSSGASDKVTMDTSYSRLRLRIPTSTRTTNVLKWTKETGADGYVIYGAPCDTKKQTYQIKKLVTIKNDSTTTWIHKNLNSATYYKYYMKAYKLVDGKKVWLAKSKVVHSTTTGGNYGNAKSVKVNKTAVSLAVGETFAIKAEQIIKDKPIAAHQNIKYESSNSKVASVTSKGVIKAKKKGTCYIYVYAQNGMYKRIKVTVA